MFDFAYPWILFLFIPYIVIIYFVLRQKQPTIKISYIELFLGKKKKQARGQALTLPLLLSLLAGTLLIIALAGPRKGTEHIIRRAKGIDIMIAIDLSGSMQAYDVPESITTESELVRAIRTGRIKNRLETAKQEIAKFIKRRPNDRIGLIAFAPLPYVACPPTLDHTFLLEHLDALKPGMIGDMTGIAGPIASGVYRLKNSKSKRRVIVLFTDGKNNVKAKISPRQAAKLAAEFDVTVYTVGIGSDRAYIIQPTPFGPQIQPFPSEFDEELLKDIAKLSGGKYYKAADAKGLKKAMDEINKYEKTVFKQPQYIDYKQWGPIITEAGLGLLILAFILAHTLYIRIP